jgi:hypothetical protein
MKRFILKQIVAYKKYGRTRLGIRSRTPMAVVSLFVYVIIFASVVAAGFGLISPAEATITKTINFQGKLTNNNASATNVANGTYAFEFKMYTALSGGSAVWTETFDQPSGACAKLTVTNGVFNAKLGSCNSTFPDFTGGSMYISVNFAPTGTSYDGEMAPRKQIGSTVYAIVANGVNGDGTVQNTIQSATALTVARSGTSYALQVDTNTALSVTGLKVTSGISGGGLALTTLSTATDENLTLDAKGAGTVSIGATSTGNILFGGGLSSTGCTVTNSTGAFACTSAISSGVAGGTIGGYNLSGNTSGTISILPQAAAGTYNFNLPTTAGTSGYILTSAGGGASPMTWTDPSGLGVRWDALIAPTGNLSLAHGANTTAFTFNSLTTGTAFGLSSSSLSSGVLLDLTATGTAGLTNQKGINVSLSGTNSTSAQTTYGVKISNSHAGTTSTNIALQLSATNGTTANYALIVPSASGNIGIGMSTPVETVDIVGTLQDTGHVAFGNGADVDGNVRSFSNNGATAGAGSAASIALNNTEVLTSAPAGSYLGLQNNVDFSTAATPSSSTVAVTGINNAINVGSTGASGILSAVGQTNTVYRDDNQTGNILAARAQTNFINLFGSGTFSFVTGTYSEARIGGPSGPHVTSTVTSLIGVGAYAWVDDEAVVVDDIGLDAKASNHNTNGANVQNLIAVRANADVPVHTDNAIGVQIIASNGTLATNAYGLKIDGVAGTGATAWGIYENGSWPNYFGGNVGIGDTTPAAALTVGSGDLFQVNSSGAIAAATGVTSSGTITFSGFTSSGGPLYTNGSGVLAQTTAGTTSQILHGGTSPSFGAVALATEVSGTLPVGNGGTGATTFTSNGVLYGNSTSAVQVTAAGTTGQCLVGTTSSAPSWASCSGLVTLQNAYDATSGNTITTTSARNIAFTFAADTSLVLDAAATDTTQTNGVIDLDVDSSTTLASGIDLNFEGTGSTSSATQNGIVLTMVPSNTTNARTYNGIKITNPDAGSVANIIAGLNVDVTTANTADTTYAALFQGGKVGIGTATPLAGLDIQQAVTAASAVGYGTRMQQTITAAANSDVLSAVYINPTFNDNSNSDVLHYASNINSSFSGSLSNLSGQVGQKIVVAASGAAVGLSDVEGQQISTTFSGTGSVKSVSSSAASTVVSSSGSVTADLVYGAQSQILANSAGTLINNAYGSWNRTWANNGTITNANAVSALLRKGSSGIITTAKGLDISGWVTAGTPATTSYGIYMDTSIDTFGSTNYALYSTATSNSYMAGNLGLGDTSPAALLTVGSGDLFQVNSSGAIAAATGVTSSGTITFSGFSTNGGLLYTNGSGVLSQTGAGTSTTILHGGTTPSYSAIVLTTDVSGTLPVGNGGTGATSFTANGVLYGNTTSAVQVTAQGGANTVLVANAGVPSFSAAITVGTSVTSPTINATTALQLGGADINTAGTLTNVAYKNQVNTFTANNIFQPTVTTGTGATAGLQVAANSLTTGNGIDISSSSLTTGNLIYLASTSTAAGSNTQTVLNVATSGANGTSTQTTYGTQIANTHTGTSSTNVGLLVSATGGTANNTAIRTNGGNILQTTTTAPIILGTVKPGGTLNNIGLAVSGKYAYAAENATSTIRVYDISVPTAPVNIGSLTDTTNLPGPFSIKVVGNYAYVTGSGGSNRFTVVDVSNPTAPAIAGTISNASFNGARGLYISGKYAYVASQNVNRLVVVDISNPAAPAIVGELTDATNMPSVDGVYVVGKYAYLTSTTTAAFIVVDVSNPTAPTYVSKVIDVTNMSTPHEIVVSGRYAYVAAQGSNSLVIIDIKDPTTPAVTGFVSDASLLDDAKHLVVAGNYAYVSDNAASAHRIAIVDVSNPASPTIVGTIQDATNLTSVRGISLVGKYLYAAFSTGLSVLDVTGIQAPSASLGNVAVQNLFTDSADVNNSLTVGFGLNVGTGGILSGGAIAGLSLQLAGSYSIGAWGLNGSQLQTAAATYTDTSTASSGTATNAVFNSFGQPTLAATNTTVTTTNASTVYIANSPAAGTNQTITNAYALWVDNGTTRLDGALTVGGAPTFSTFTTNGGLLYTNASGVVSQTGAGTSTTVLHGGTTPSYSAIVLTTDVSGTLPVGNGGTGATSFTSNGVLYGNSTSAVQVTAQGGANTVLVANAGVPSFSAAITVGTSVTSPTINATTALQLNGVNINTAGTLTNVAYLNQVNTFTANNIFQPTVTTGTGATAGLQVVANSLTTGNGLDISSTSLTTGNLVSIGSNGTAAAASQTGLNILLQGATATNAITSYGAQISNTHTNATSGTNVALYLNASGATTANYGLIVNAGNVGLGNTAPSEMLDVTGNGKFSGTVALGGTAIDANAYVNVSVTNDNSLPAFGLKSTVTRSVANSFGITGAQGAGTFSGTGTHTGGTIGVTASSFNTSSGTLSTSQGLYARSWNFSTGTITTSTALFAEIFNLNATGTITSANGVRSQIRNSSTGTITTAKGIDISNWLNSGTVGTSYGIYLDTSIDVGSTKYALYSLSTSDSYMAGNFGLGDSSPAALLTVGSGDAFQVNSSGAIAASTGITSSGNYVQSAGTMSLTSANTTQTTTSSAFALNANSLTSGTGLYAASSTLSSGKLVDLQVSGTAAASNTQTVLNIATAGANATSTQTTYGAQFANTHTGTASTNIGLYATASGGTNNYAAIFDQGNVGIATTTPVAKLHVNNATGKGVIIDYTQADDALQIRRESDDFVFLKYDTSGNLHNNVGGFYSNVTAGASVVNVGVGNYNNGLFAPSSSSLGLATGGTEAIRIDSSQKVGIGTTAPADILSVGTGSVSNFNVNASGDAYSAFTTLNGTTTANGPGTNSTTLILTNATDFDAGNYVKVSSTNCVTSVNICYAKIVSKFSNTLTISPALTWATSSAVVEMHVPEIGGTDTANTLANRYGRGYFIDGIVTGNGSTNYSDGGISQSLSSSTFNFLANGNTSTLNIGTSATTVNIAGALSVASGDLTVGAQADATAAGFTLKNTAAGTFGSQTGRDGVSSYAVYNGKLYAATARADSASVFRYDGGTTWTLITDSTEGKIISGDSALIDSITLTVYNGKLYAGSQTGSGDDRAGLYSYNGSSWTQVNSSSGEFGGESGYDDVNDMVVFDGSLYIATKDDSATASVYRYDGGNTFIRTNDVPGACSTETASMKSGKLTVYNNRLFWGGGSEGGNEARLCVMTGWDNSVRKWQALNGTNILALGTFVSDGSLDDIGAMAVHNGRLYFSTRQDTSDNAQIYSLTFQESTTQDNKDEPATSFRLETVTLGKIDDTNDSAVVDTVPILRDYNGRLYAGGDSGAGGDEGRLYEYDDTERTWTRVTTTAGTFGSQTNVDAVSALSIFNGTLYVGTSDSSHIASVYTWSKTSTNSYALKFDSGNGNYGTISFVGNETAQNNTGNMGNFLFSHSIVSTTGAYDVAEDYPTREQGLIAGDVLSLDTRETGLVVRSQAAYDRGVVGIYSTHPGLRLSQEEAAINGLPTVPVALAGRVPVNIAPDSEPILPGDYLVSSGTYPGKAMKALASGPTIGKALESWTTGTTQTQVMVLVNLSWNGANNAAVTRVLPTNVKDITGYDMLFGNTQLKTISIGSAMPTEAALTIKPTTNNSLGLLLQAPSANSTGNLFEINSASGALLSAFSARGELFMKASSTSALSIANSSGVKVFNVDTNGKIVTIGNSSSPAQLQMYGKVIVEGDVAIKGSLSATNTNIAKVDVAENYPSKDSTLTAGEVVMVDIDNSEYVKRADAAASAGANQKVIGVISTDAGVTLGAGNGKYAPDKMFPLALVGRVPVKVTSENGAIEPGDFLTASLTIPGAAMKATKAGSIIGQALESYSAENAETASTGSVIAFVKPTDFNGASIQNEMPGLVFDYADSELATINSYDILAHLLVQLPNLDPNHLSQINTDVVIAGGEVVTPTVTTHSLRADILSAATAEGGLSIASSTVFNGGLKVDSIGSIGTLLSIESDVEFFGIPYFTADTAGFAIIKPGAQSVDIEFTHEYVAQPMVNATISFENDINYDLVTNQNDIEDLKNAAISTTQSFLQNGISYAITNKTTHGFTIVLNKPAPSEIKFSWISLAVKNANTFTSIDTPSNQSDSTGTPPPPSEGVTPPLSGDGQPPTGDSGSGSEDSTGSGDSSAPAADSGSGDQGAPQT